MTIYAIRCNGKYYGIVNGAPVWTPEAGAAVTFSSITAANLVAMDPDGLNLKPTDLGWEIVPVPEVKP